MKSRNLLFSCRGASLSEVLVAIAVLPIALMGAMGAFQTSGKIIAQGTTASRALAMAESRIEAKRGAQWGGLLEDDLDYDGRLDVIMRDDGQDGDLAANDGIYSASREQDGVSLSWTVTASRPGDLTGSGAVLIEVKAAYGNGKGRREVNMATMRANPLFVGQ
jgi:hypothetical protein